MTPGQSAQCRRASAVSRGLVCIRAASLSQRLLWVVVSAVLTVGLVGSAQAQAPDQSFLVRQRQIEQQQRELYDRTVSGAEAITLNYGAYVTQNIYHFDDGLDVRTLSRTEVRPWARLSLDDGLHTFYVRGYGGLQWFSSGDSYDGKDVDWEGPYLDRAWYKVNLDQGLDATRADWASLPVQELSLTVGRDFVEFGTGLALAMPLDMVRPVLRVADLRLTGLLGRVIGQTNDIDRSRPGSERSNRTFAGVQLEYVGIEDHTPFVYVLWTDDQSIEKRIDPSQAYDYDANYVGVGSKGSLFDPQLLYRWEYVHQFGSTFGEGAFTSEDEISAHALAAELLYTFEQVRTRPRVAAEYVFASGDEHRFGSPSNTAGGNLAGTRDHSFNGFGYRNSGLAFAPALSNIQFLRTSASFNPLEGHWRFRDFRTGIDVFIYGKHEAGAAVSDPTADRAEQFLGWEIDYVIDWRLTSDLSWTARVGNFFPGSGFSDRSARVFVFTRLTWSF